MKRARIGTTEIDTSLTIWTDGQQWMRLNVCEQYADISALNAEYNLVVDKDADKAEQLLNRMDIAYTTIKIIEAYGGQSELLERAGIVLGQMIDAGEYAKNYASMDERNTALNSKIAALQYEVENWQNWQFISEVWQQHWQDVMNNDYYADPATGERLTDEPGNFAAMGVTATTQKKFMDAVADCGGHWLYSCVEKESDLDQLNRGIPSIVRRKRFEQIKQADWIYQANSGLTANSVYRCSRAGIMDKYNVTPENAVYIMQQSDGQDERWDAMMNGTQEVSIGIDPATAKAGIETAKAVFVMLGKLFSALLVLSSLVASIWALVEAHSGLKNKPTDQELAAAEAERNDYLRRLSELDDPLENLGAEIIDFVRKPIVWIVAGGVLLLRSTKK